MTTQSKLTREQKRAYLKADGVRCPYCRSDEIEGGHVDIDAGGASQRISCHACGRSWYDGYKLVSVEEEL
jgi:transposase-like protein